jgi:DNA-binding NtrC family response regulator
MAEKPVRVLIVDDEEEYVSVLAERLRRRGLEVSMAPRADEALALVKDGSFDVALVDLVMPEIGGLELLKNIRTVRPSTQVILLTGRGSVREGVEGMRLGAFDYLNKLQDIETLVEKIRDATRNAADKE